MRFWTSRSLTLRTTILFAAIACTVIGMLGAYFYHAAKVSLARRADTALISRVDHFSRLVREMYTVSELKDRPVLFETMLGAEADVLLFAKPGDAPFIAVNPERLPVPDLRAAPADRSPALADVRETLLPDGVPMHWAIATARSAEDGELVEVVAGHPMTSEARMLASYRNHVILAALVSILAATLLAYVVLDRGLRSLRGIAAKAAEISPANLSVRLNEEDAPLELRRLTSAFNAMLDRLADGYERLTQFSADLAHEIRTPVGALIGQTQVTLAQPRRVDEYQQVLESNLEELNRLSHIAQNILFLAQADHAEVSIERAPMVLCDELNRIAEYFEGPADEKGMKFDVKAEGVVHANPTLCRRAISNLVINAVRYGTRDTTVRLVAARDHHGATIAVENECTPIPAEQLNRLFDRFYRGDTARSGSTESSGLGLAIVKAIMSLHGGSAQVSCPRAGLIRFELRFRGE